MLISDGLHEFYDAFDILWKHIVSVFTYRNDYLKIYDHVIVIYNIKPGNQWKFSIDNEFSQSAYTSRERAMSAAFEKLEMIRKNR